MRSITVTRDSVHPGDDIEDHTIQIEAVETSTLSQLLQRILSMQYLPQIDGGKASWSVCSTWPLAVHAQEWPAQKIFGYNSDQYFKEASTKQNSRLHF